MTNIFKGRLGIIQRVKPSYRVPFFDHFAQHCSDGLGLFWGKALPVESIPTDAGLNNARSFEVTNRNFGDPSWAGYLCYQQGLIGSVKEWKPNALIVEANFRYLSSYRVLAWAHKKKIPLIGWGLGAKTLPSPLLQVRNAFIRQFDSMVAYSEAGAAEYAAIRNDRFRVFVAKNAVTDAPTEPMPARSVNGPIRVLFVGRLQARKRVDLLIRCAEKLPAGTVSELVIVGDGPERAVLEQEARAHITSTRFTGYLEGEPLANEFRKADILVLPGTGGLALQQAMSYGLPVIVAEGDGTQNDLVTPANGWQVKPGSESDLVAALSTVITNRHLLPVMGNESYRIVKEEINITNMVHVFMDAIQSAKENNGK